MHVNYKKTAKFLFLILTSVIIAAVSAETYRYMYIDGSITVGSAKMIWALGADAPAGSSVSGSEATVDMSVEQGTPVNFTECLFLKNDNATGQFSLNITVSTAVLGADFTKAQMHIYQNSSTNWVYVDTIDLTNSTDIYSGTLNAQNFLRMTFEVEATTGASGNKPFDIEVVYK